MTTKTKTRTRKAAKTAVVYLGTVEYAGYELRCCAATEKEAKDLLLAEIRRCNVKEFGTEKCPTRFSGYMTPGEFWEYVGGNVVEMPLGKVVWP